MATDSLPTLRAGILGAGLISDIHVLGLRRAGVQIAGIADGDVARARAKAKKYDIPAFFSSSSELLESARPDVVHVLTPPATHAGLTVQALEHGCHVYVEKPFASSLADCDSMIAAADRTGRRLCVGHCMVYDPLMRRLLAVLDSGRIGRVIHATASYVFDASRIPDLNARGWYRRLAGGVVEDLTAHPASLLLKVLGEPYEVTSLANGSAEREGEGVVALISAARGTGTLLVSIAARPEEVSLEVRGTRGTIRANFSSMVLSVQREGGLPRKVAHGYRNLEQAAQLAIQTVTSTAKFLAGRVDTTKGIHSLIAEFYRTLRMGEPVPVSGEEGRHVVQVTRSLWPGNPASPSTTIREQLSRERLAGSDRPMALVTGATGFIGVHLVRALVERGMSVRALARDAHRGRRIEGPGVHVAVGDIGDPETTDGLCEGVEYVFHLASAMTGSAQEFERVDLAGGRRLLEEAKRAGVKRFVFASTMGAYALGGLRDGAVVTEEQVDDPERVGNYSRAKLTIERLLKDASRAGEIEAVVARLGLVFGPGISPYLTHLPHLGTLRGDRYVVFGDGEVPLSLTYVSNAVEALLLSASSPRAAGETFTIVDDDVPTQREYVRRLGELTGRPLRVTAIPRAAAWAIGLSVEAIAALARRKPPTTRRLLLGKTTKVRFDCTRAKELLGWTPAVHWEEGLRRAVEWELARRSNGAGSAVPEAFHGEDSGNASTSAGLEVVSQAGRGERGVLQSSL